MKAQIVEQVELFSEAELQSLEFVPEELEAIEAERVPDLDSISFEEVAKDLEAYFEGDVEGAGLEGKKGSSSGIKGGHDTTKKGKKNKDDHQKADAAREKQQYNAYVRKTKDKNGKNTKKVLTMQDWRDQCRPSVS
ncbi:MAG: hypothetical protein RMY64_30425 [Nostoc sp. DedQUE08]|uniref:hypothetical protein n=1 Tax=Nostoc sp. DedQUE08 TaxID=3075393 RepID=UPI002AD4CDB1|nr:hypothetical protein [Nostoc sp. DedQUE08]MDZ8069879.1 hypothetical protein [Nostoc sp. DedQUE08]